jgi:hypothetical protein
MGLLTHYSKNYGTGSHAGFFIFRQFNYSISSLADSFSRLVKNVILNLFSENYYLGNKNFISNFIIKYECRIFMIFPSFHCDIEPRQQKY